MTLAQYRKGAPEPKPHGEPAHEAGGHAHPNALEYIKIGSVLAFITAVEVGLYYIDMSHTLLVVVLIILSALKFSLVVLWFMHLRFDDRRYARFFVMGLAGAATLYLIVLIMFGAFSR
jgi:cytochrome c oxidase subunit IV